MNYSLIFAYQRVRCLVSRKSGADLKGKSGYRDILIFDGIVLLFTVPVTSNASRHLKSPLAMGEMPFNIKRVSSVPISVVIDTGVNSNGIVN